MTDVGLFEVAGFGVDDVTLGFDMTGSRSIGRLNSMPGIETRWGKRLGERGSWGVWANAFGRSAAHWKPETCRLYVQAKLSAEGTLCCPRDFGAACQALFERMALVGVISYEPAWVTRLDVAVDAHCEPAAGKLLLDALEAARLPNGWRSSSVGNPRSTVYFKARASEKVKARAYCRNLKLKQGEPYGQIRLEAQERFEPGKCLLDRVEVFFLVSIWNSRYGRLTGEVRRLNREVQTAELAERVAAGELSAGEGERVSMLLDLERLGLAQSYYSPAMYAARRRLATQLGFSANQAGTDALIVNLDALLAPYAETVAQAA
jgi:hypothetical protein